MPSGMVARLAFDRHCILRKHREGVKQRPMMFAAVETMTNADPIRLSRSDKANIPAQATASETVHAAASPLNMLMIYAWRFAPTRE
jgi:hypothetical protein